MISCIILGSAAEALHGTIVNAVGNPRHALFHPSHFGFLVKYSACILESPVTVKHWMCPRILCHCLVKGLECQGNIIAHTYPIGDDASVIEVQNRAEIYFVDLYALIPLELCNVCKPFPVWLVCMELAV